MLYFCEEERDALLSLSFYNINPPMRTVFSGAEKKRRGKKMAAFPKRIPLSFRNGSGEKRGGMCSWVFLFLSGCCIWTTHIFVSQTTTWGGEEAQIGSGTRAFQRWSSRAKKNIKKRRSTNETVWKRSKKEKRDVCGFEFRSQKWDADAPCTEWHYIYFLLIFYLLFLRFSFLFLVFFFVSLLPFFLFFF